MCFAVQGLPKRTQELSGCDSRFLASKETFGSWDSAENSGGNVRRCHSISGECLEGLGFPGFSENREALISFSRKELLR